MGELLNPRHSRPLSDDEALLFFEGPIQGAPDWQTRFGQRVLALRPDIVVASPRVPVEFKRGDKEFNNQVDWEEDHILRAIKHGGVAVWFAAQDLSLPYRDGRAYAQTTRIEVGELLGWRRYDPTINVAIGFDPDYSSGSERYIRRKAERVGIPVASDEDEFFEHIEQNILNNL